MRLFEKGLLVALAATVPAAAGAQPILRDMALWNANASGTTNGGWWNTRPTDGTYNIFLSTVPDAQYAAGKVLNPNVTMAHKLAVGANRFWFYSSTSPSTNYGMNLFFGDAVLPGSTAPHISAKTSYGTPGFSVLDASVVTRGRPDASLAPGAGSLSYTQGSFIVTLTNLQMLGTAANSGIDRVGAEHAQPDWAYDNHGTFTLNVVDTAAPPVTTTPEPGTWALLGSGLLALGVVARRRRTA